VQQGRETYLAGDMKTPKILLISCIILLLFAVNWLPSADHFVQAQEETPQPESVYKTYLPFLNKSKAPLPVQSYSIGPTGGTFTAVVVDPTNSSIIYLGTYGAGVYKSNDDGNSWTQKSMA